MAATVGNAEYSPASAAMTATAFQCMLLYCKKYSMIFNAQNR